MIKIAMIPMTDDPMEGVAFDVQDHAQWIGTIWTGTHGEMISFGRGRGDMPWFYASF
jgi:hypothetical protein